MNKNTKKALLNLGMSEHRVEEIAKQDSDFTFAQAKSLNKSNLKKLYPFFEDKEIELICNSKKRVNPTKKLKVLLLNKNANSCCVCKQNGVALEIHHIDGDNSNTIEENLAVLCVSDHNKHHNPSEYINHTELSTERILAYKNEWEDFVSECKKDNPKILATINVFGHYESITAIRLIFQTESKIIFQRDFQALDMPVDKTIDRMIEEIHRFGKNIKFVLIDSPLDIDFCEVDNHSFSYLIDKNKFTQLTTKKEDWDKNALASLYINPQQPTLALIISYKEKILEEIKIHVCANDKFKIFYTNGNFDECIFLRKPSRRAQITKHIKDILKKWDINEERLLIGTGEVESPQLLDSIFLPKFWER